MFKRSYLSAAMFSQLTTIEKRLIPFLESRTDLNGQLVTSYQEIKDADLMSPRLIHTALNRLENHGYIYTGADGNYYSNFHYQSSDSEDETSYRNIYKFFGADTFKKQHKLYYNLFYYFFTSKFPGVSHTVAVEQLYENKLNRAEVQLHGFQNYNHFSSCFCSMVANGHIEVEFDGLRFSNPGGKNAEEYSKKVETALFNFCTRKQNSKRKTRLKNGEQHLVKVRIHPDLISNDQKESVYARRITLKDLSAIALKFGYNLEDYSIELLSRIHTYKLKMYKSFGNAGIQMYQEALEEYFQTLGHQTFESNLRDKDFLNVLDKFFVLPKIKLSLQGYLSKIVDPVKEKGLLQKLETMAGHLIKDYPDKLSSFVVNLKQENEGLFKYALEKSLTWRKLFAKAELVLAKKAKVSEPVSLAYNPGPDTQLRHNPHQLFKELLEDK
ncbi:hypothetical protein V4V35_23545 [Bacillus infantis]|uniref:hypothetical protein n=1 Tax=Bacillus infantis TaxID=324767 RepID=UPI002FBE2CAB